MCKQLKIAFFIFCFRNIIKVLQNEAVFHDLVKNLILNNLVYRKIVIQKINKPKIVITFSIKLLVTSVYTQSILLFYV